MEAGRATVGVAKAIVCAAAIVAVYLISTVRLDRGIVQTDGTPTAGLIAAGIAWLLVVWVLLYRDDGVRGRAARTCGTSSPWSGCCSCSWGSPWADVLGLTRPRPRIHAVAWGARAYSGDVLHNSETSHTHHDAPGADTAARLDETLLGGARRYTLSQVVELTGLDKQFVTRYWRWIGLPVTHPTETWFTDADVEALKDAAGLFPRRQMDERAQMTFIRSVGHTSDRLALWQVEALVEHLARRYELDETSARLLALDRLPEMSEMLQPPAGARVAASARGAHGTHGHRVRGGSRGDDRNDSHQLPLLRAVGFADIVSFTKRTAGLGSEELAEFVQRFEAGARDVIVNAGGRVVKTIGDAVLFVTDDISTGAEVALGLAETSGVALGTAAPGDPEIPVRVGLVWGRVLSRFGDIFGPTVNLASRLTEQSDPSTRPGRQGHRRDARDELSLRAHRSARRATSRASARWPRYASSTPTEVDPEEAQRLSAFIAPGSSLSCSRRSAANVRRSPDDQRRSNSRFAAATASGRRSAIRPASAKASSSGVPVTVPARPRRPASAPVNSSAVKVSRFAVSMPTSCVSARIPDMSGTRPRSTSLTHQRASGVVRRRSAARAICTPAPNTWPCTAAITGTGRRRHAQQASWNRLVPRGVGTNARATAAGLWAAAPRSSPAQNDRPLPETTTARSPGFRREPARGRPELAEHVERQRVELVGPVEADVGDPVREAAGDAAPGRDRRLRGAGAHGAQPTHRCRCSGAWFFVPAPPCRRPRTAEPSPCVRRACRRGRRSGS